jgi:hypothetical protein
MEANDNGEFVFEVWDDGKCVGTMTFSSAETEHMNRVIAEMYADGLAVRPKEAP